MAQRTGPLDGVAVLDLSRLYPGAFLTSLLADLGASVVKIEAPGVGDMLRVLTPEPFKAGHVALNKGKRSLSLDLRQPAARDVLRRLAERTDVIVESHRPGALEDLGIGYDDLRAGNPGLVWCSLTGFGSDGPLADAPGHDLTYLGASGVLSMLAAEGAAPPVPQITLALQSGALMGAVGILSALHRRAATGEGMRVDAPLTDSLRWFIAEDVARAANAPGPGWPSFASRAVYRCADGRYVTVTASEPKPWAVLCAALDLPDLAGHRIGDGEEAAIAALTERFATRPAAHWLTTIGPAGGVGPVHSPADVLDDEQVVARRGVIAIDAGTAAGAPAPRVLANPLRLRDAHGAVPSTATAPPPDLGEHSDAVLRDAGFTDDEIAALRDASVI